MIVVTLLKGCGANAIGDGPMKSCGHLGNLPVVILVDTGGEFDCIHHTLANSRKEGGNIAYLGDVEKKGNGGAGSVSADDDQREVKGISEWNIGLYGSHTNKGTPSSHYCKVVLYEFEHLRDAIILGCLFIDLHGGLSATRDWFQLNQFGMSRVPAVKIDPAVVATCRLPEVLTIQNLRS